jgi:hypothetical protein
MNMQQTPRSMVCWKIVPEPAGDRTLEYIPFLLSRKYFAVDDSGSTAGAILKRERAFVDALQTNHANPADVISLWGTGCDDPTRKFDYIQWLSRHGGTAPSAILKNEAALEAIRTSDVWFLLTDGEVWDQDVHNLADLALEQGVLNVPLIFVITGSPGKSPSSTNISVGISFFASSQDTLILFKETGTGKIYVIAGKGCFAALGGSAVAQDLESWGDLPLFADETSFFIHCRQLGVRVLKAESRISSGKGISLGAEWEERHNGAVRVDLDLLPQAGVLNDDDVSSLLAEEAFDTLAVAYKTRSRIAELRTFVQKQKIEQIAPTLEDVADAASIIGRLANNTITETRRKELQEQLRIAHATNRDLYQQSSAQFAGSEKERSSKTRNQLVDAALRSLASIEAAGFSAEILSRRSNRARRAEVVGSVAAIDIARLNLDVPSCKGFCLVCCGEDEVMSICFKESEPNRAEDNTTDFALNFPLAAGASTNNVRLISSQNICYQCALLAPLRESIYKEPLTAIIPAVQYDDGNKKYINDQLYLALTAQLATGAAGIAQLFMAILTEVLRTKPWAGAGLDEAQTSADEQHEAIQRRKTFQWMLDQLVQNTRTREDFKETGSWVKYPQALSWVAKDFHTNKLASFAVTYPAAGFDILLNLGARAASLDEDLLSRMRNAKAIYSIAAKYMADVLAAPKGMCMDGSSVNEEWKQSYLEVLYHSFNGPLVPKDQGDASILTDVNMFKTRLAACIGVAKFREDEVLMRKVQIILFWLLYKQKGHCTAQTFFTRLVQAEPLAGAVLDPIQPVPRSEHRRILLSVFAVQEAQMINPEATERHMCLIPFTNPFGASVLRCGAVGCMEQFCTLTDPEQVSGKTVNSIRNARTKHLIEVFGIKTRFEESLTGLPERADGGRPPTSIHNNLHISIAREWAAHGEEQRRAIMADGPAREQFVKSVIRRLCTEGRGNIFQDDLDHDIRVLLPSFFDVLEKALRMQGREGEDVAAYEHDFAKNRLEEKVRWELEAAR